MKVLLQSKRSRSSLYQINALFITRLWKILKRATCTLSLILCSLILLLSLFQQILVYYTGLLASKFSKALVDQDSDAFQSVLLRAVVLMSSVSVVNAVVQYSCQLVYLHWRRSLCTSLHRKYFTHFNYLHINTDDATLADVSNTILTKSSIDNVDQRMTADVDKLLSTTAQVYSKLILSPFTISYYTYQCYITTGYIGPVVIFGVFCFGTIVNKFIMAPVVANTVAQEAAEGNFRYFHMKIRSYCQSIAFYRGQSYECESGNTRLEQLLKVQSKLFFYQFIVKTFTSLYDYMGAVQSYLVIAIPIFSGQFKDNTAGERSEIVGAYSFQSMYLIYCFSQLIDLSNQISEIAGVTHRVGELIEFLTLLERETFDSSKPDQSNEVCIRRSVNETSKVSINCDTTNLINNSPVLIISSLSFGIPLSLKGSSPVDSMENLMERPQRILVKNLSIQLFSGDSLLITGPNGVGKSSLFRVLNEMWASNSGQVIFNRDKILFLPQTPYFCHGSLLNQIYYPQVIHEITEDLVENALHVLEKLKLDYIVDRCGGSLTSVQDWDWSSMLSQGEAQKLSFARILLNSPSILFLDEATSAVSNDEQLRLYDMLSEHKPRIECFISIAHTKILDKYHNYVLTLSNDSSWNLEKNTQ